MPILKSGQTSKPSSPSLPDQSVAYINQGRRLRCACRRRRRADDARDPVPGQADRRARTGKRWRRSFGPRDVGSRSIGLTLCADCDRENLRSGLIPCRLPFARGEHAGVVQPERHPVGLIREANELPRLDLADHDLRDRTKDLAMSSMRAPTRTPPRVWKAGNARASRWASTTQYRTRRRLRRPGCADTPDARVISTKATPSPSDVLANAAAGCSGTRLRKGHPHIRRPRRTDVEVMRRYRMWCRTYRSCSVGARLLESDRCVAGLRDACASAAQPTTPRVASRRRASGASATNRVGAVVAGLEWGSVLSCGLRVAQMHGQEPRRTGKGVAVRSIE